MIDTLDLYIEEYNKNSRNFLSNPLLRIKITHLLASLILTISAIFFTQEAIAIVIQLIVAIIIIFHDLDDQYLKESLSQKIQKLKESEDSLEKRVAKEIETNRVQTEQMMQQSRLAQMGEMLSMIAHQWRQPLTAISATTGNLSLKLMMDDVNQDEFSKEIGLINDYAQHLSNTIDDFRDFFNANKEKQQTSLEKIVTSTMDIIRPTIEHKSIKIATNLNSHIVFKTYANEVSQVLLNLIKNAEDALLENTIKNPTILIETYHSDKSLTLRVKDNGGGIPQNIIDKIFDPYFSTKLEKDGTGLGLYMSKTIIEEHCEGKLSVRNDSEGAIFTIQFKRMIDE